MSDADTSPQRRRIAGLDVLFREGTNDGHSPLVLLHGIGSRSFSFLPLIHALNSKRTIIAWDAPGYGASLPLAAAAPCVADYCAALRALLDAAGVETVDLLGHSLGTLIAAHFAVVDRNRVNRLILVSPTLGHGASSSDGTPKTVRERVAELELLGAVSFARKRSVRLVFRPEQSPAVLQAVTAAMATMTMPGYGQAAHILGCGRILDDTTRLDLLPLIIVGAEDVITPPECSLQIASSLPSIGRDAASPILVEEAGHAICLEAPDRVAILVERHLTTT